MNGWILFQLLSTDFEIGHFLRARVIPKAALYYTGDIVEDDDDDDYDEGMQMIKMNYSIEKKMIYRFKLFVAFYSISQKRKRKKRKVMKMRMKNLNQMQKVDQLQSNNQNVAMVQLKRVLEEDPVLAVQQMQIQPNANNNKTKTTKITSSTSHTLPVI